MSSSCACGFLTPPSPAGRRRWRSVPSEFQRDPPLHPQNTRASAPGLRWQSDEGSNSAGKQHQLQCKSLKKKKNNNLLASCLLHLNRDEPTLQAASQLIQSEQRAPGPVHMFFTHTQKKKKPETFLSIAGSERERQGCVSAVSEVKMNTKQNLTFRRQTEEKQPNFLTVSVSVLLTAAACDCQKMWKSLTSNYKLVYWGLFLLVTTTQQPEKTLNTLWYLNCFNYLSL